MGTVVLGKLESGSICKGQQLVMMPNKVRSITFLSLFVCVCVCTRVLVCMCVRERPCMEGLICWMCTAFLCEVRKMAWNRC